MLFQKFYFVEADYTYIVPVTLIRHQVKKHSIEYLLEQECLNPHPKELILRNHI
jgi:uncharacterized protein YbgA (DUF1722 family)